MKMRLMVLTSFLLFISLFVLAGFTNASNHFSSGKNIVLPKDQVVDDNYFGAGNTVLVNGTVNGDVYVAGGNIVIDGTVNGDVLAAGGNITVGGTVNGNIRAAGGQITITGNIEKNISIVGGQLTLQNNANVGGSFIAAGGNISVLSPVGKSVSAAGGQIIMNNSIGGNVNLAGEEISLEPQASIAGSLNYWSSKKANITSTSQITKETTFHLVKKPVEKEQKNIKPAVASFGVVWGIMSLIVSFIIGLLFLTFLPVLTSEVISTMRTKPWASLGVGFLTALIFPVLVILLMVTVVGIPVAIVLLMMAILMFIINDIFIAILIGHHVLPKKSKWGLLAGLVIYGIVLMIPVIGGIVGTVGMFIVLGAVLMTKKQLYMNLRSKKLI